MPESKFKPIVFLAFANEQGDGSQYLRKLPDELRALTDLLEPLEERGFKLVIASNATLQDIQGAFRKYRNRIVVFHYAGHADSYKLLLEAANGQSLEVNSKGLAQFLSVQNGLKFVFLNGCSTQDQAQGLLEVGVPAVLATDRAINDQVAREFAEEVYKGLFSGASLQGAVTEAEGSTRSDKGDHDRHLLYREDIKAIPEGWPWKLEGKGDARAWRLADSLGDPTFGLPAIPRTDLPAKPFRHLSWFRREDAEIFFGRGPSIRDLFERINGDGDPIILLYGQSGVGKSSLLDAGVRPRLEVGFEVRYARRDKDLGLLGTLHAFDTNQATSLRDAWLSLEQRLNRPVVIILDQLEEVFTRPNANLPDELDVFLKAVQTLTGQPRPQGKLILGFRKEWLAEIERRLEAHGLPFVKRFLEPLDHDGVIEAVRGPSTSQRLIEKYGLEVSPGLPAAIAQDMLEDRGSPVATTLQILLTRMFDEAKLESNSKPTFDLDLYQDLKKRGILLGDFLDQQLEQLAGTHPEASSSGLALDVLAYHTTALGTAEQRGADELKLEYGNRDELEGLLQALKDLYLLAEASGDAAMPEGGWPTRLSHDTLAPLVRKLFDHSDKAGQRAKRILENRAVEWAGGMVGTPLDERDLEVVERGEIGMRAPRADEMRVLEVSREERKKRELEREAQKRNLEVRRVRDRRIFWGGMGLTLVAFVLAGLAYWQRSIAEDRAKVALSRQLAMQSQYFINQDLSLSLILAIKGNQLDNSLITKDTLLRNLQFSFPTVRFFSSSENKKYTDGKLNPSGEIAALLEENYTYSRILNLTSGKFIQEEKDRILGNNVTFSSDKNIIVSINENRVIFKDLYHRKIIQEFHLSDQTRKNLDYLVFSENGREIALSFDNGIVELFDLDKNGIVRKFGKRSDYLDPSRVSFGKSGKILISIKYDGKTRIWDTSNGKILREFKMNVPFSDRIFLSSTNSDFSPNGDNFVLIDDNFINLYRLKDGKLIKKFKDGNSVFDIVKFNSEGNMIVSVDENRKIKFFDISNGKIIEELKTNIYPNYYDLKFTKDKIISLIGLNGGIQIFDQNQTKFIKQLKNSTNSIEFVEFSSDDKILASSNQEKNIEIWNLDKGKVMKLLVGHKKTVKSVSFSLNKKNLASLDQDGIIHIWDLNSGKTINVLHTNLDSIAKVEFSKNNKLLASLSLNSSGSYVNGLYVISYVANIQLWELDSGKEIDKLQIDVNSLTKSRLGYSERKLKSEGFSKIIQILTNFRVRIVPTNENSNLNKISNIVLSPDGKMFATAERSGKIQLWDTASGQQIGNSLSDSIENGYALAFNSDGTVLASGRSDGIVRLWDVSVTSWRTRACRIAGRNPSRAEWKQFLADTGPYEEVCPDLPPGEGAPADSK